MLIKILSSKIDFLARCSLKERLEVRFGCVAEVLGCRLTYYGQAETNAGVWLNIALRPRKPEGSLGRGAQDRHLDSHTVPTKLAVQSSEYYTAARNLLRFLFHLKGCDLWSLSCDFVPQDYQTLK